jgi:hypothetical protein
MAFSNRTAATALLARIKSLMNSEAPNLKVRQDAWQKLINEAVELDDFDAENLATDCRREADSYSGQLNKIILQMKRLISLLSQDRRSGLERRQKERRRLKLAVAVERRKGRQRRQGERRKELDGAAAFIKKLRILVKAADKSFSGYNTDKDRFAGRVDPEKWDATLIGWVGSDNPNWTKLSKMFKELFKMNAGG